MSLGPSSTLLQCWECSPRLREVLWDGWWELARAWLYLQPRWKCSTGAKGEAAATSRVVLSPWQSVPVPISHSSQLCSVFATCHRLTAPKAASPESLSCRCWLSGRPPGHLCLPLLKSTREYNKSGRSWHVPVVGSSIGRRAPWGVPKTCRCFWQLSSGAWLCSHPLLLQGLQEFCLSSPMILNNVSPAPCCELGGSSQLPVLTPPGPAHGLGVTLPGTRAFLPITTFPHHHPSSPLSSDPESAAAWRWCRDPCSDLYFKIEKLF